jgi:hypothetical protein
MADTRWDEVETAFITGIVMDWEKQNLMLSLLSSYSWFYIVCPISDCLACLAGEFTTFLNGDYMSKL